MKILDSHVHFWNYDAQNPEFDWITEHMVAIKKSFLPEDLIQNFASKIQNYYCIAVQAAETWEETEFLLNLAAENDFIKGVIGWVDITNHALLHNKYKSLKGFRHILQAKPHGYMTSDPFRYFISKLHNQNYTYDLLLKPHQLHEAYNLVCEFPNQKFVIDHMAKPDVRNQDFEQWKADIDVFKHLPNVYAKLSGLITEAFWNDWKPSDFRPVFDTALQTFGTKRLMYGSDWPVCILSGNLYDTVSVVTQATDQLSPDEQSDIFYNNAKNFYNIV